MGILREWVYTRRSLFGGELIEGVIVRRDDGHWLTARAKLVRPSFTQALQEHWGRRTIEWNRLCTSSS